MLFDARHKTLLMRILLAFCCAFLLQSCFPVAVAPNLREGKVKKAKKFNRKLPNRYAYLFTDPKDANEFYAYVNTKYDLNHNYVEDNVRVLISNQAYYVSFYEVGKKTQTVNLLRPLANKLLEENGAPPVFNDDPFRDYGDTWYIALLITDEDFNDALHPDYKHYKDIRQFAASLHREYYSMSNYKQATFTVEHN